MTPERLKEIEAALKTLAGFALSYQDGPTPKGERGPYGVSRQDESKHHPPTIQVSEDTEGRCALILGPHRWGYQWNDLEAVLRWLASAPKSAGDLITALREAWGVIDLVDCQQPGICGLPPPYPTSPALVCFPCQHKADRLKAGRA